MQYYDNFPYTSCVPPCMMMQNQNTMSQPMFDMQMQNQYMMPQPMFDMQMQNQYMMPQPMNGMMVDEQYTYPQNLPAALKLIQEAVAGENEDRRFYEYLISTAPSEEDKKIIEGIRDDEISHFGLFRQIYFDLTGRTLPPPPEGEFEKPSSYCEGIKRAIQGEQGVVPKYRRILFAMQSRVNINKVTGIITDELRHASLYNYLYAKNKCSA